MTGTRRSSSRRALAAALGGLVVPLSAYAQPAPAAVCDVATFAALDLPRTRFLSAAAVHDDERAPPHCVIRGAVNERTGQDGKPYAIGFEMRLPDDWNGRYFHQLNGGNDGTVVRTDSGHDGRANPEAGLVGGNVFGFDHEARLDYGYAANLTLTPIAKDVIEAYYGRPPEFSYMVGCSNGGRHALVGATRLAEEFDGFLAGAPGHALPKAALQHAWDVQSFAQVTGDVRAAFSRDDMRVVADGVLEQCDALDGVADGIVGALAACQQTFELARLACTAEKHDGCLDDAQIRALERAFAGPSSSDGTPLYAKWWFDAGLASNDWRSWKLESAMPGFDGLPLIATLGAGSLAQIFTT